MASCFRLRPICARIILRTSGQPILDCHCHPSLKEIADNRHFANPHEVWLGGDHNKWHAMGADDEQELDYSGNAASNERFSAVARTVFALARCFPEPNVLGRIQSGRCW